VSLRISYLKKYLHLKIRIGYIIREVPKPAKQMTPVRKRSAKSDWNIPQIYILGFISARYKNGDF